MKHSEGLSRRPRVVFFIKIKDRAVVDRVEFYRQDLSILRQMGFDVVVVTRIRDLVPADFYFVWWWTWGFFPILYAKTQRKSAFITGVFDHWRFPSRPILHQLMMRFTLNFADANIFVSEMEFREVPSVFSVKRPTFIPIGVDTDHYVPGNLPRTSKKLLTIAGMTGDNAIRKGVPEAIEACAILRHRGYDVTLTVAGERGSGYQPLLDLSMRLGIADSIHFPGVISVEEKIRALQECACYLQPSKFEGFGLAMLEAMSCGAPVVARPGGAIPEVLGSTGVLVEETGAEALADGIEGVILDPQHANRIGIIARDRACKIFSIQRRFIDLKHLLNDFV